MAIQARFKKLNNNEKNQLKFNETMAGKNLELPRITLDLDNWITLKIRMIEQPYQRMS